MQDALLHVSKRIGLFRLSRYLTRRSVRILCYHGFARTDETEFRPGLFVSLPTFEQRMQTLSANRYFVTSLDDALGAMDRREVRPDTVVITVDDVFHSFATDANPILERHRFPVTAYVTTYYSVKGTPVFRLLVRYMFWKTNKSALELSSVDPGLSGSVDLKDSRARAGAEEAVIRFGEALAGEDARVALAERTAAAMGVDIALLQRDRVFHIVTPEQIRGLVARGVDVQLHTHRHRFPVDADVVRAEITDNRNVLEPLVGRRLTHFCYPSGDWSHQHWPGLTSLGVASATTCDVGLNVAATPRLGLKRILDAEDISPIRFEAEVSGFKDLVRRATGFLRGRGTAELAN